MSNYPKVMYQIEEAVRAIPSGLRDRVVFVVTPEEKAELIQWYSSVFGYSICSDGVQFPMRYSGIMICTPAEVRS